MNNILTYVCVNDVAVARIVGPVEMVAEVAGKHDSKCADERSNRRYVSPLNLAIVYAGLGERASTLDWQRRRP